MQYLQEWRGGRDKRKRRAEEESNQESSRKRSRDDAGNDNNNDGGRRESIAIAIAMGAVKEKEKEKDSEQKQEFKIRGSAITPTLNGKSNDWLHLHPSSPFPESRKDRSPSSPLATADPSPSCIHPDRLANISVSTRPLQDKTEHINDAEAGEQIFKPLHSTSPPNSNLWDTNGSTLSSLDAPSPDQLPVMTSHFNDKSRNNPSHTSTRMPSIDDYRRPSNPPSRRQSDVMPMPPPANATKIPRSETSTPKATSPPTNSDLEHRKTSSNQPQLLDSLNDFARAITSAASLNVRHDHSKQQTVGLQKERDRQSKFKTVFLTLMEDAESRAEGAENVSIGIEKQIDLSSQAQSRIAKTLAARLQKAEVSDALPSARDRGRCKEDFAELKADLNAARKKIDSLNREAIMPDDLHRKVRDLVTKDELRGLATKDELRGTACIKDELRGLVTRDELRRVATDEVRNALVPTEKKLASLTVEDANLSQMIIGVEVVTQKHREMIEENDRQQAPRFGRMDTSMNDMQERLSRLDLIIQGQQQDYTTFKVDLAAQDRAMADLNTYVRHSSNDFSLDKIVARSSNHIQLLQQDVEKLENAVRQTRDFQATSEIALSHPVSKTSITNDTGIEEEVKLIRSELDALRPEQEDLKLVRRDLDAFKADQEKVILIRADLDSLVNEEKLKDMGIAEGFEVLENSLKKQHEDLGRLQHELRQVKQSQVSQTIPNHPPTPPFASASTSPCLSDHQKLQDLEKALKDLTKSTQGLELFVNHQQQKFDGLTSDRIVQSMIHQMQQMYPQHPGNCFDGINQCLTGQAKVDRYLGGHLHDRLVHIESQIAASVDKDSKIEEVTRSVTDTRKILLANVNSLKQEIDGLRGMAINKRPQDPSDYNERIDELVDRVTAVEAKYVKAIHDFQITHANVVHGFTQLRYQSGIDSMQNALGELTATSRCSRSVEPNGTTLSENFNDSDTSDTPLSLHSRRGVREERRSFDPTSSLKRKAVDFDDDEVEAEGGEEEEEAETTNAKKVLKRRNVSGKWRTLSMAR